MPQTEHPPTIYIVEDDAGERDSLVFRLESEGYHVRAYGSGLPFLADLAPGSPGCLLLDVNLPDIDGEEVLHRLTATGSRLPVILITAYGNVAMAVRAMKAGAVDFIEKPIFSRTILGTVERVLTTSDRAAALHRDAAAVIERLATLSDRERSVFWGVVDGKIGKEIAAELGISPRTVEIYRMNAMVKLHAKNVADMVKQGMLAKLYGDNPVAH
ncbi:MAG: response regulator transcription factor [Magnetospirillum sp.]|nr:response regulator transcription factor [Magnetospirillum sp.]